jgi:hypothetical protein
MKPTLFAATALIALSTVSAGPSLAAPPRHVTCDCLYNQNSNFGPQIDSQNFTSGSFGTANNDAAADDFVVPSSSGGWKLT